MHKVVLRVAAKNVAVIPRRKCAPTVNRRSRNTVQYVVRDAAVSGITFLSQKPAAGANRAPGFNGAGSKNRRASRHEPVCGLGRGNKGISFQVPLRQHNLVHRGILSAQKTVAPIVERVSELFASADGLERSRHRIEPEILTRN